MFINKGERMVFDLLESGKNIAERIATPHLLLYKTAHARCVTAQLFEHNANLPTLYAMQRNTFATKI